MANDQWDDERAARKAWDPAARCDDKAEFLRLLASDPDGFLRRAEQAARRAAALARTPRASDRAVRQLARLGRATARREAELPVRGRTRGPEAGGDGPAREPPVVRLE